MNCQQPARLLRPMQNERKLARPIVAKFSLRPEDVMSETARNLDQIVARQNEELAEAMTFGVDAYTSEAYLRAERDKLWCKVWLQFGRVEDLPEVGRYLPYDILDDSIIVVRTGPDASNEFYTACTHTGRKLHYTPPGAQPARGNP